MLLHCGAVMIALLSLGKNTGGERGWSETVQLEVFHNGESHSGEAKTLKLKKKKKKYFKPNAAQTLQTTISMSMVI